MPTNSNNERSILDNARQIDLVETRSEYLAQACGDDSEMLNRIQRQLHLVEKKSADRDMTFIQTPPASLSETDDFAESVNNRLDESRMDIQPGTIIAGRYELLEPIGQGGMGSVWLAEQTEPVHRQVAVKLIKAGMDSYQVISRFNAERQALAVMDHPHIAKVFDGGLTDEKRPYFVMEYVEGVPITQFCDQRRLSIRDRLELFKSVCRAVQHAHQKGIIHRDLKPSNILVGTVDGQSSVKVIDFGLAKATERPLGDQTELTAHGMVVGTPLYMSPEQAESIADIDTRTDVYSLGVILYELLTGSTPLERNQFGKAAHAEIMRVILEIDPPKPSSRISSSESLASVAAQRNVDPSRLKRSVSGDMDWVVMKALEKDREQRYQTANGLAADIQRHLDDEPVSAGPPSAIYRFKKFYRKNRVAVATAAFVLVALLIGVVGTSYGLYRESVARELAEANEKTAREQSQLALATLTRVIVDIEEGLQEIPGSSEIRRRLLSTSLEKLGDVSRDFLDHAIVDQSTVVALTEMAELILEFGDNDGPLDEQNDQVDSTPLQLARTFYEKAYEMSKKLYESNPANHQMLGQLAINEGLMGRLELRCGHIEAAQRHFTQSVSLARDLNANGDDQLKAGVLTWAFQKSGGIFEKTGDLESAKRSYTEFNNLVAKWAVASDGNIDLMRELADSFECLGSVARLEANVGKSLEFHQKACSIYQQVWQREPTDVANGQNLADSLGRLGDLNKIAGRSADAVKSYQAALEINTELFDLEPNSVLSQFQLSVAHSRLGDIKLDLGSLEHAFEDYKQALAMSESMAEKYPNDVKVQRRKLMSLQKIAKALRSLDRPDEAFTYYASAETVAQEIAETSEDNAQAQDDLVTTWHMLGNFHVAEGDAKAGVRYFQKAVDLAKQIADRNPSNQTHQYCVATTSAGLASAYKAAGRVQDALEQYDDVIATFRAVADADSENKKARFDVALAQARQGDLFGMSGDREKALNAYRQSAETTKQLVENDQMNPGLKSHLAVCLYKAGRALADLSRLEDSVPVLESVIDVADEMIATNQMVPLAQRIKGDAMRLNGQMRMASVALGDRENLLKQPASKMAALLEVRSIENAKRGNLDEALWSAKRLKNVDAVTANQLYNAACVFAMYAKSLEPAQSSPQANAEQSAKRKQLIDQGIATLREAIAAGYDDSYQLANDTDLQVFRENPDFEKLLGEN